MSESVSGRPAEIRRISAMYLFILYGLCALFLTGCTGYDGKNDLEEGGIFYRVSSSGRKAFVQALYWDLDPAHTEFVIPDRVGKAQVVSLGGFYGTGVPCPLQVSPQEDADYLFMIDPETYESERPYTWQDIVLTIHLGKEVSDIKRAIGCPYFARDDGEGAIDFYRPVLYFEVDPENRYLYSQDGFLYYRKDDSPVTDLGSSQERAESGRKGIPQGDFPGDSPEGFPAESINKETEGI